MKVLIAHNRYRANLPSGENRVVDSEIDALRESGIDVITYLRSSDEIDQMSLPRRLAVPVQPLHSARAVANVDRLILEHRPEIFHLHNPFPLISLSVVGVAHRHGLPVVQTVHNHRHSCMRGSYFRDGHPCFECRGKPLPWPAVGHGCYRDSRVQSVPMAVAFLSHRNHQRNIDRYIALSEPIAQSLLASGLTTRENVRLRPNSVPDPGPCGPPRRGLLYVGRLTVEKGVPLLLQAWVAAGRPFGDLTIIGAGPEHSATRDFAADDASVRVLGGLESAEVGAALASCAALVVPSTASEGLPLVVLEALACGRPVVASDSGGIPSAVDDTVGWLCQPTVSSLTAALRRAGSEDLTRRGRAARRRYEERYSPQVVIKQQLEIYRELLGPGAC